VNLVGVVCEASAFVLWVLDVRILAMCDAEDVIREFVSEGFGEDFITNPWSTELEAGFDTKGTFFITIPIFELEGYQGCKRSSKSMTCNN